MCNGKKTYSQENVEKEKENQFCPVKHLQEYYRNIFKFFCIDNFGLIQMI